MFEQGLRNIDRLAQSKAVKTAVFRLKKSPLRQVISGTLQTTSPSRQRRLPGERYGKNSVVFEHFSRYVLRNPGFLDMSTLSTPQKMRR